MFAPECTRNAPVLMSDAIARTDAWVQPASPSVAAPSPPSVPGPSPPPSVPGPSPPSDRDSFAAFKEVVRRFVHAEKDIARLAAQLKALRAESCDLKCKICSFMEERDVADITTREMRLKLKTSVVKPPLKQRELKERISEYLGSEERGADLFEKVYRDRAGVERTSLRRTKV